MKINGKHSRSALVAMAITASLSLMPQVVWATTTDANSGRSTVVKPKYEEQQETYSELADTTIASSEIWLTESNVKDYSAGTLSQKSLGFTRNYINFIRQVAGLDTINLTQQMNANASQGALLLARLNRLTRNPGVPAGLTQEDVASGQAAVEFACISRLGTMDNFMKKTIDDSLGSIQDRDVLLQPNLQYVGAGAAHNTDKDLLYTVVSPKFDVNEINTIQDWDYVAWPASGYMLSDVFGVGTPWSVMLRLDGAYAIGDSDPTVTIRRVSDNTVWTPQADVEYWYSGNPHIVFNPTAMNQDQEEYAGTYEVTIDGLAGDTSLSYNVTFGSAESTSHEKRGLQHSGYWGTCPWYLYNDGTLEVEPGTGLDTSTAPGWEAYANDITMVVFTSNGSKKVVAPANSSNLFGSLKNLEKVDLSGLDTSKVTDMSYMFSGDKNSVNLGLLNLKTLNLTTFDTSSVKNMQGMFLGCENLARIDFADWDTSSVKDMSMMFAGCYALSNIDLSKWTVSSVETMAAMFDSCATLTTLDLSAWNTKSVKNMAGMFGGCEKLTTLAPNNKLAWNTKSLRKTESMFEGCTSIKLLDLSAWNTSVVTNITKMFFGCSSLAKLDLSGWNTNAVTQRAQVYDGCDKLASFTIGADYVIYDEGVFPAAVKPTAPNGKWWSVKAQKWFTRPEIVASRSGIADT